jgi:hypothetical protein
MTLPPLRILLALCLSLSVLASNAGRVLERFDDLGRWRATPSDGVEATLAKVPGPSGNALRVAFDFHGGAGYTAVRGSLPLALPANYEISFWLRGEAPVNTLEFKLIDPGGENVWWARKPQFQLPGQWTRVVFKKRHLTFAWGPAGGGEASKVAEIEFALTAGQGGKGFLDIADLSIQTLPPATPEQPPIPSASSSLASHPPALALDGRADTAWRSQDDQGWFQLDFGTEREFGGLVLQSDEVDFPQDYAILASHDGRSWEVLRKVRGARGGRQHLALPEAEARFLRIAWERTSRQRGWGLSELRVMPLAFSATPNAFFEAVAKDAPRGDYPRAFLGEQTYWTLVGVDGGQDSGLLGEDGAIEAGRGGFSVEPFLWADGVLSRWSDAVITQSLEKDYLPIPAVTWKLGSLSLQVKAFGTGPTQAPVLRCRYLVANDGPQPWKGRLFLAIRPFQVNHPLQFMGTPGGVMTIRDLGLTGNEVQVNGRPGLIPGSRPDGFGALTLDQGPLTAFLRRGLLPEAGSISDPEGHASGALRYDLELAAGQSKEVLLDLPLGHAAAARPLPGFQEDLARIVATWEEKLNRVAFQVPDKALVDTLRTSLAHILISRQGPALQPGTRAYARSWIRDGALISSALLQLGHSQEVRDFIQWYAPNQFASGKIPCVVDERGADPVPENDSHGEFIYLVAEYCRATGDWALLQACWPRIEKTCDYIDTLLQQRRTPEYRSGEKQAFFGLMPESISHEGYSARPMHSYWDDFFTLRGLKDATYLAARLGRKGLEQRYAARRDAFSADLYTSIQRTMARHKIAYLPGCAELGDFDPTSTTIALSPGGELGNLPRAAVERTFEAYYQEFVARRDGRGKGDRYTPYEMRIIGSFFQLGWNQRAEELLSFFLTDRRPRAWNQWPEVVQQDLRLPIFLGDLPHAWVGSDFIRSVLLRFAQPRESDQALVVGAGLPEAWLRDKGGVRVTGLRLGTGRLNLAARAEEGRVSFELSGAGDLPAGGIAVPWPLPGLFRRATLDGRPIQAAAGHEVIIHRLPVKIIMER